MQGKKVVGPAGTLRDAGLARAGLLLLLFGLLVLAPLNRVLIYGHAIAQAADWHETIDALAAQPAEQVTHTLELYATQSQILSVDPPAACLAFDTTPSRQGFFALRSDGSRVCGPLVDQTRLEVGQWTLLDGQMYYATTPVEGGVAGLFLDAASLVPPGWERFGLAVHILDSDHAVIAANHAGTGASSDESIGFDGDGNQSVTQIADSNIEVLVDTPPYPGGHRAIGAFAVGVLALCCVVIGTALRLRVPFRYWGRSQVGSDELMLLHVDQRGLVRGGGQTGNLRRPGALDELFAPDEAAQVADLLSRSRGGELLKPAVLASRFAGRSRVIMLGWNPLLRRHLVLVTRYIPDPLEEGLTEPGNLAGATLVSADGQVLHAADSLRRHLGTHPPVRCDSLSALFGPKTGDSMALLQERSQARPYRFVRESVRYRCRQLAVTMMSDDRGLGHVWVDDDTDRLHGDALRKFLKELRSYLERETSVRPDLAALARNLTPITCSPEPENKTETLETRAHQLVADARVLVRYADKDRFIESGRTEMMVSTAKRREIARRLHDGVVQDLVALRWNCSEGADIAELTEQALQNVRSIMDELSVPPWQQSTSELLEDLLVPVRSEGICANLRVELPVPVPYEVISTIGSVAKETLTNALRHANSSQIAIDVRMEGSGSVSMTVHDDGTGHQPRRPGSGYGHTLCRQLAKEYGGTFTFEATSEGHIANLSLPLNMTIAADTTGIVDLRPKAVPHSWVHHFEHKPKEKTG